MRSKNRQKRLRDKCFRRDKGICNVCGTDCIALSLVYARYSDQERRQLWLDHGIFFGGQNIVNLWYADHIIPLAAGGGNDMDNIQTLCYFCNRKKNREDLALIREKRYSNV